MQIQFKTLILTAGAMIAAVVTASPVLAETPYQGTFLSIQNNPDLDAFVFFPALPPGKRLRLDETRIRINVAGGTKVTCTLTASIPQVQGLFPAQYFLDAPKLISGPGVANGVGGGAGAGKSDDVLGIDQTMKLWVDSAADSTLTLHCNRSVGGAPWTIGVTIIGTLQDLLTVGGQ